MDHSPGDLSTLTQKITVERGFGCASYKEKCLSRRIAVRMRARGVHTYADYARLLDADAAEYDKLLDVLTINVTKLFRNWDTYSALAGTVIPDLWSRETPAIRVWSAGCSSGQEPYSLAVLFHRHAATAGMLPQIGRVDVLGTDIDRASLAAAQRAQFAEPDFADTPDELRQRYFTRSAPFAVSPNVRGMVRFERRDLLNDPAPPGPFELIACRNMGGTDAARWSWTPPPDDGTPVNGNIIATDTLIFVSTQMKLYAISATDPAHPTIWSAFTPGEIAISRDGLLLVTTKLNGSPVLVAYNLR